MSSILNMPPSLNRLWNRTTATQGSGSRDGLGKGESVGHHNTAGGCIHGHVVVTSDSHSTLPVLACPRHFLAP